MSRRKVSLIVACILLALFFLVITFQVLRIQDRFCAQPPRVEIKRFDLRSRDTIKIKLHFTKSIFEDEERPNVEVEVFV